MRRIALGLAALGAAFLQIGCAQPAPGLAALALDPTKNVYIVTHIDVMPNFADGANQAIRKYAADSRKDPGAISVDGLVQDGRPNHFTLVEIWQSRQDFEAHDTQPHTRAFRETLHPMLGAPFDERLHQPMP